MKNLVLIILAVAIALGIQNFILVKKDVATAQNETAYERIMRTRTIRCGYFVWPPFTAKDPNTGTLSGFNIDVMDALGKVLDLKVDWSQELNFSSYLQDLADGRYDAECASGWPNAKRGQMAYFAKPLAYMPLVSVVRADDSRFDQDQTAINSPAITVATIDGETSSLVRESRFPQTRQASLPSNTAFSDLILNVTTGKADVTFLDFISARQFDANNPGKIKILNYNPPLYLITLTPTLPQDDRLKQMIDIAIDQLQNSGQVEAILKKYEDKGSLFLRVNTAYQR